MGGRSARNKGGSYEREVSKQINEALGLKLSRTPRSGAWEHAKGDLYGWEGFSVECKRQERLRIEEWWEQAERDCPDGDIPLLIFRRNRTKSKVILDLDDFLKIMASLGHLDGL